MSSSAKWPSPLAENWVGGDIGALQALAATLYGYLPRISCVTTALDEQVARLTDDASGWRGPAASAFSAEWRRDVITADALAAVIGQAARIVDGLATELAAIEGMLEAEASTAAEHGVRIGLDGRPPLVLAPRADVAAAGARHWTLVYRQAFEQAMAEARQARQRAACQLTDLYATIDPPRPPLGDAAGSIAGAPIGVIVSAGVGDLTLVTANEQHHHGVTRGPEEIAAAHARHALTAHIEHLWDSTL